MRHDSNCQQLTASDSNPPKTLGKCYTFQKVRESYCQLCGRAENDCSCGKSSAIKRPGWGTTPPDNLPARSGLPRLTTASEELIFEYVLRQPEEVVKWALDRSAIYEANKPDIALRRAHLAAALDVIQWQRPDLPTAAEKIAELEGIEAAHNCFTSQEARQ